MPGIDSLRVDTTGWKLKLDSDKLKGWTLPTRDGLSSNYFPLDPDLPVPLTDVAGLRNHYRQMIQRNGGGLVEADVLTIKELSAIRTIFRLPQGQSAGGTTYLATLTFPFKECSFVFKASCVEQGTLGLREEGVARQMGRTPTGPGWAQDPYDSTAQGPFLRTLADDSRWDEVFLDHPLTRARRVMRHVENTLIVSDELKALPKFTGPSKK